MKDLIYDTLYNKIEENYQLDFNKDIGNRLLDMPLGKFDILKVADLNNSDFIKALYLGIFNRNIENDAYLDWSKKFTLNSSEFKKQALSRIIQSNEFKNRNIVVINNIFFNENTVDSLNALSKATLPYKVIIKVKIRRMLKYFAKYLNPFLDNEYGNIIKNKVKKFLE